LFNSAAFRQEVNKMNDPQQVLEFIARFYDNEMELRAAKGVDAEQAA